ncbi:MAG: SIMPL domain-containing protein [Acidobacteriaceae bacterium]|nr:SIMPL domain-containing protein [Acidobacteriaceae bacterium]MBV9781178.1 SIMPL domain-containing protein [Acidobacteriaceae bacterium]
MWRILIFLICLGEVKAQSPQPLSGPPSIRVHGQSTLSVKPDQAELDIGVITRAASAKAASDQNAAQADRLLKQLRALLPSATIETVNFSVNPTYRYPKDGGTPEILGYSADNTVRVVLDDLSMLRKVIDVATKTGATNINRLDFTLHDEKPARARALADAASQAESAAEALAASLKLKLGPLLLVEESQPVIISPARQVDLEKLRASDLTPISPGNIDVHANVDLTYEIVELTQRHTER